MPRTAVKKIIYNYAQLLKKEKYGFSAMYLFGSQAKGTANTDSDIDVAVVTDMLKKNYEKNRMKLYNLRLAIDTRLEPHGFTQKDFNDNTNPLAYEIRKTGIRVL
jgi:predicted nucleotidyltransferase